MVIPSRCASAALFLLIALTSCSKEVPTETVQTNKANSSVSEAENSLATVSIVSITPDPNEPLRVGTNVKLKVDAAYVLPPKGGMIGVVIQGSESKPLGSSLKSVPGGPGEFSTEIEFVVPNAKNIMVHIPLYMKGEGKSTQVAVREYQVKAK